MRSLVFFFIFALTAILCMPSPWPTALFAEGMVDPGRTVPDLCPGSDQKIRDAEEKFWQVFHHQKYSEIQPTLRALRRGQKLAARQKDSCGKFLMHARIGFLNTWQVAETPQIERHLGVSVSSKAAHDAAVNFQRAVELSHGLKDPGLVGAGRLTPAVVEGFWLGFFPLTKEGAKVEKEAARKAAREKKSPAETKEAVHQALNKAVEERLDTILANSGWFNIGTPVLLPLQTDALSQANLHGPFEGQGQNVAEIWETVIMCSKVDPDYAEFIKPYTDRPYFKDALEKYEEEPPWDGVDPPAEVVRGSCKNWHNVPHAFEGTFLVLGDIMALNCFKGLVPEERCGPQWREDVKAFYQQAKSNKKSFKAWGYGYALEKRLGYFKGADPQLPALMKEISGLGFPACMMCHQNSTDSPKK